MAGLAPAIHVPLRPVVVAERQDRQPPADFIANEADSLPAVGEFMGLIQNLRVWGLQVGL
jgi:hypothetical protein